MKHLLTAAALAAFSVPAFAQGNCGPEGQAKAALAEKYGETPAMQGIMEGGVPAYLEIWINEETGTWTALVTRVDGISCVAASGNGGSILRENLSPASLGMPGTGSPT